MNDVALDNLEFEPVEDVDVIQLVGMKLGDEEYAIDVLKIQEIIRTVEITIVPRSEGFILGVMNLRGKVIPVVDLRVRFNLEKVDFDKSTRIIVVGFDKENIGFVVDEVTQVINIKRAMVEPTPPLVGVVGQEYILGICKYREQLMILLDIDKVVGTTDKESSLRHRLNAPKVDTKVQLDKAKKNIKAANKATEILEKSAEKKSSEKVKSYSMADEADAMLKGALNAPTEDHILSDIQSQAKFSKMTDSNSVEQSELDGLIAKELAKREAETDELNRQKKGASSAKPASDSLDDLILLELEKREAETDELNKRKKEEIEEIEEDIEEIEEEISAVILSKPKKEEPAKNAIKQNAESIHARSRIDEDSISFSEDRNDIIDPLITIPEPKKTSGTSIEDKISAELEKFKASKAGEKKK